MSTTALALPPSGFGSLELVPRPRSTRPRALVLVPAPGPRPAPASALRDGRRGRRTCPSHPRSGSRSASRPLRITRRGRLVLSTTAATVLTGAVLVLANAVGGPAGAVAQPGAAPGVITVVPGQTLSQIASALAPGADWREVAAEIVAVNDLPGQSLRAGQRLVLPDLD